MIVISIFSYITPQYQKLISIFVFYHHIQIRQDNFIKNCSEMSFFLYLNMQIFIMIYDIYIQLIIL